MNIYETAIMMEQEGIETYKQRYDTTNNTGLRAILRELIEMEESHLVIFKEMRDNHPCDAIVQITYNELKATFKDVKDHLNQDKEDEIEFYKKVKDVELNAHEKYLEFVDQTENNEHKEIFKNIANEEKKHAIIIDNIIELLKKPDTWVESPEFTHLGDLY